MAIESKEDLQKLLLEDNSLNVPKNFDFDGLYLAYYACVHNSALSDEEKTNVLNDYIGNVLLTADYESALSDISDRLKDQNYQYEGPEGQTLLENDVKTQNALRIADRYLKTTMSGTRSMLWMESTTEAAYDQHETNSTGYIGRNHGKNTAVSIKKEANGTYTMQESDRQYNNIQETYDERTFDSCFEAIQGFQKEAVRLEDEDFDRNIKSLNLDAVEQIRENSGLHSMETQISNVLDNQMQSDITERMNERMRPGWHKNSEQQMTENQLEETSEETGENNVIQGPWQNTAAKEQDAAQQQNTSSEQPGQKHIYDDDELNDAVHTLKRHYEKWRNDIEDYANNNCQCGISVDENGQTVYTAVGDEDHTALRKQIDQEFKDLYAESERVYQMSADTFAQSRQEEQQSQKQSKTKSNTKEQAVDAEYKTIDDETNNKQSFADKIRARGQQKSQQYDEKIQKYKKQVDARKDYNSKYNDADLSYRSARANRLTTKANKLNNKRKSLKNAHGLNRLRKLEVNMHAAEVNWRATRATKKVKKIRRKQLRQEERYERAVEREQKAEFRKQRNEYFTEKEAQVAEAVSGFGQKMSDSAKRAYNRVYNGFSEMRGEMNAENIEITNNYYKDMANFEKALAEGYGKDTRTEEERRQYSEWSQQDWETKRENLAEQNNMSRTTSIFATMALDNPLSSIDTTAVRNEGKALGANGEINGLSEKEFEQLSKSGQALADQCTKPEDYLDALFGIQSFENGVKEGLKESGGDEDEVTTIVTDSNLKQIEYRMADPVLQKAAEHWDELPKVVQDILSEYPAEGVSSMQDYLNRTQIAPEAGFAGFEEDSSMMAILKEAEKEDKEAEQMPGTTEQPDGPKESKEESKASDEPKHKGRDVTSKLENITEEAKKKEEADKSKEERQA